MNRKLLAITLAVLLALLLSVGGATGQEPEGEVRPQGDVSVAAAVNSRISYQGILKEGGTPVSENRDMIFRLYSNSSCTTLEDTINKPGVQVTDGLFSVELDVYQDDFNGQGLWLGVDVGNTGANVVCEEILPTPYALSLRPGAVIVGERPDDAVIRAENTATTGYSDGVYGRSPSTDGAGVCGWASATSGTTYGVYGRSYSTDGRGVYGYASATSGTTEGVYGQSSSNFGYGGFFINDGGGDLLAANNAATTSDLEFRVDSNGAAYADGGWQGAADFAELMSTEGDPAAYEPGDVLVVSAEFDRSVALSSEPYSPMVLGVYSEKPGFVGSPHVMEGQRDDEIAVAIVGIVACKVSADNGPIRRGDLLVTSSTPGHAMRAGPNPPVGTVVGKALGSLDSGTGFIQILVTLQ